MSDVIQTLNNIAVYFPWDALVAAGVISPLLVGVKKWLSIQSGTVMFLLVTFTSLAVVLANYFLYMETKDPTVIATQTAILAFMTQPVYYLFVKRAIAFFRSEVDKAAQLNAELKSAAIEEQKPAQP